MLKMLYFGFGVQLESDHYYSVDQKRGLIRLATLSVEIEFMNDARGYALMVLTEKKQKTVGACREDVDHGIRVVRCNLPQVIGDVLGKDRRVRAARHALLSRPAGKRERNQAPHAR